MSLRAQRNFCWIAVTGVLWTVAVLWLPVSRWHAEAHGDEVDNIVRRLYPRVAVFCVSGDLSRRESRRPEQWEIMSIVLLAPGVLAVVVGVTGSSLTLFLSAKFSTHRAAQGY